MKDIFNKRQRFSIRKFSVGVASVLIGITLFTPSQGVLASTENNLATEIGVNSERENSTPTVEKKQESQSSPENRGALSSPAPKDTPIGSTRTTELETSGKMGNNSLTTRASVAGEDRSSTPAVRAASNPSEIKKYELTEEDAKKIKAGVIGSEGNKLDSLLLNGSELSPEAYTDDDYLKDKDELYIYEKGGKKYVGYNSHPLLEDTDGDGIIDSKEKSDEKLKWNVSERDMIMFMELSYRDDNYIDRVLNHKKPLTESELYKKNGDSRPRYEYMMMNKELGPYWERKKSYHTSSGLDAVLYETKSDFSYLPNGTAQVLAFRGTSDAKDIGADITLGLGSNPQQGIDAENIMRELAKDKSITNLYLTGHSLGGYLVQRAMVEAYQLAYSDSRVMSSKEKLDYKNFYENILKKGTTFNAPKVRTSYFSSSEFWQKGLDSKKIAKSGKMTHYIVNNDSTIGKSTSNDSDVVINVGDTKGGHSSRSYFEADMINRRSEFISGKRISLDGTGYQDKKMTTVKSVEKVGETAVYSKRGDDIIKSTTVSIKDPDTGQITKNTLVEVFKKDGAKSTVVVTSLEPIVRYEKDATRAKGEAKITVAGIPGTRTVTTTYTVNSTDGSLIPHEGPAVEVPSEPTVVKVPAKDEIEYLKEGDDVVKKTTTYTVNVSTGHLTPIEKKEIFKQNGAKAKVVVTPLQPSVRYEKDATRAKGGKNVTTAGTSGTRTVTTTYTVNPADGSLIPHEGKPVIKQSTPTVVKVPAKDEIEYLKEGDNVVKKTTTYAVNASTGALTPTVRKDVANPKGAKSKVVVTPLKPSVRYEKDATKAKGGAKVTVSGTQGTRTVTTTYTVNPTDGRLIPHEGKPVIKSSIPTVVKVPAKDEVEYLKEGDDVVKKTTTYEVNASTGSLIPTEKQEVFKRNGAKSKVVTKIILVTTRYEADKTKDVGTNTVTNNGAEGKVVTTTPKLVNETNGTVKDGIPVVSRTEMVPKVVKVGAKDKVVETLIEPEVEYVKDVEKDFGTPDRRTEGEKGKTVTTTTYDADSTDGHITEHVGNPVVSPAGKTIVKVGAKTKVERSKDPEGRDVIDTTTYEVDPKTGKVTPTTVTTYGTRKEATVEKKVVPSPVVYEKDDTKEKGTEAITVKGEDGEDTITTTYKVNPTTGEITPSVGKPVRTKEPTNTIVKVPAKDKVDVETIPSPVKYEKDTSREKGQDNITVPGKAGSKTTTTTYTVNPNNGEVTPNVGEPVIVKPTDTIIKVAAKDKVVYSKDGDNIVKEVTTYIVNPTNGNITGHTTKETFKENGLKDKVEVETIPSPVKYEKDTSREKGQDNITVPGKAGSKTTTTTYTLNPNSGEAIAHVGEPVIVNPTTTIVKVAAKDKVVTSKDGNNIVKTATSYTVNPDNGNIIEHTTKETFKENGLKDKVEVETIPSPVKYEKDASRDRGQENITVAGKDGSKTTTTTYTVNPDNGEVTPNVGNPVIVNPTETIVKVAAKDKVVETPIEPAVVYEKDDTRDFGTPAQRTEGEKGKAVTTTTYDVDPKDGHITEHVDNPVVTPAGKTIVKVGAKTKVERSKDDQGREVINTTTYEVDPKTGKVTPTTVTTYGTRKEATVEKRVVPSLVRYEKDDTKEKGTEVITVKGEDGEDTITTTYKVNPTTGEITPTVGKPVRTKEPTETVVKVPAKDKVVDTLIEPAVVYEKDDTRDFGTPAQRTEGEKGKTVTTTTYDVDPTDGHITEHVGTPVVTPVGKTIVKVGAKTKVEQSKDPEGRDVIDTTTYEVDPKTGKVTPTTVRTYGTSKESTTETRPVPSPVVYEKDDSRDKDSEPVRKEGTPGEETITTTYTVDPKTGAITPTVGKPVRTKEPTNTVVKVGAKDKVVEMPIEPEVEYVKDVEKEFGTPDERTEGKKGKTVTTTTYDVDSNDGHITEHVDNPVVTPAGKTIVKVGAKTKVEHSKDSEDRDVIDTTTYEVDSKTGKVTPTTVRTYGTRKEPTVELEQNPKTGDVTVTPKKPDGSTYPPGTTVEIPVKGDKPITVTIGEDGKGKVPNSELPEGKVPGTGKITEPGKPSVEVPKVTIFENGVLPDSIELPELMIEVRWIDESGNVLKPSLKTGSEKDTEHGSIPGYEFVRTMIAENEPVMTHIFSKVSGTPTPIPSTPPKVTAENGVLPDSIELPELMIEVRWIDESGNVLKPSLKTGNEKDAEHGSIPGYEFVRTVIAENEPAITYIFNKVSGTTNTIPVTPDTNEDSGQDTPELTTPTPVAPVTPDTNGNSGQDTPAPTIPTPATPVTADTNGGSGQDAPTPTPATPTPNAVTPNANQENTTDAIDNGVKSKDSQNVLPNTGTESNATLASLGLLGILGGLGLALGKKKED